MQQVLKFWLQQWVSLLLPQFFRQRLDRLQKPVRTMAAANASCSLAAAAAAAAAAVDLISTDFCPRATISAYCFKILRGPKGGVKLDRHYQDRLHHWAGFYEEREQKTEILILALS